jgi:tetratricopeptide (TPR) repeat protein
MMSSCRAVGPVWPCVPLLLASCAAFQTPEQPAPAAEYAPSGVVLAAPAAPSYASFERHHRDRAEGFAREGKWAGAAAEWEILALLRPDSVEYGKRRDEAQAKADAAVRSDLQAAADARQRGDLRSASALYLKALSADPGNTTATDALREIEREQALRLHAGNFANGSNMPKQASRRKPAPKLTAAEQQELESAAMLLHQGDYAVSAQKLQDFLRRHPQEELAKKNLRDAYAALGKQQLEQGKADEAAGYLEKAQQVKQPGAPSAAATVQSLRKDLAQEYYEKGVRMQSNDLSEAIRLWEQALQYDPAHAQARLRLKQAKQMERNLDAIEGTKPKQ